MKMYCDKTFRLKTECDIRFIIVNVLSPIGYKNHSQQHLKSVSDWL